METRGLILSGGKGTRLYPATAVVSKQLLPVYDKPLIYYPLANLMSAGIREICIVTAPDNITQFQSLLGDGSQWGIDLVYKVQEKPEGIPQAYLIARDFLDGYKSVLILGDNVLVGSGLGRRLLPEKFDRGAQVFAYEVEDPTKYGNIRFKKDGSFKDIVEKPKKPFSSFAVPGIYFCDESAPERIKSLKKSKRGELEITDLMNQYAKENQLNVGQLSRGTVWIDTGNARDLSLATEYIRVLQQRQGRYIACLEEIALRAGWIEEAAVRNFKTGIKSEYTLYVRSLRRQRVDEEIDLQ
jgi:glucose-1-phosphate thymidylyltransferase